MLDSIPAITDSQASIDGSRRWVALCGSVADIEFRLAFTEAL